VYSVVDVVTELLIARGVCWNAPSSECHEKDRSHYVTYADGAYMVVKVDAERNTCPDGKPFIDKVFLYFDDYILGLLLWNRGYKVIYCPVKAGLHFAHRTVNPLLDYYGTRAEVALMTIVKTRFKVVAPACLLRKLTVYSLLCAIGSAKSRVLIRAVHDGLLFRIFCKKESRHLITL
jgi:GT2 family glycosyltransferase